MKTFKQLELISPIQRALKEAGYKEPTPIQAKTIPQALSGRDVLGCAQTGTGKTAAFGLPVLNRLGSGKKKAIPHQPFALVLVPARELAIQIGESFAIYGKHLRLRTALVYGGVNQAKQVRQMQRGVHILVATPGRLLDLMQQRQISLDLLSMFVLDEADRMMDMGFLPDLKRIISRLPEQRQSLFFSATLAPNIVQLSKQLLHKPAHVNVTPKTRTVERIAQHVMFVNRKAKQKTLNAIASGSDVGRLLAFTRTKRTADRVSKRLEKAGIRAAAIHGNKSQNARVRALESFRGNRVQVLVATDVASRGIDVDGVTHVVNYDMPEDPESYVHRIGRTGRAGSTGSAISLCSNDERGYLKSIEKMIGQKVAIMNAREMPELRDEQVPVDKDRKSPAKRKPRAYDDTESFQEFCEGLFEDHDQESPAERSADGHGNDGKTRGQRRQNRRSDTAGRRRNKTSRRDESDCSSNQKRRSNRRGVAGRASSGDNSSNSSSADSSSNNSKSGKGGAATAVAKRRSTKGRRSNATQDRTRSGNDQSRKRRRRVRNNAR
ncbi:MAG: DEAD/DEAH box helicase [Planctomycetota bacterium]